MTIPACHVEHLSKRYRIGSRQAAYGSLRDSISSATRSVVQAARRDRTVQSDEPSTFWALRDVSFRVEESEVLGIIGRNGAGKSTLLKVLAGITTPTEGRVTIHGRVGSLLEVGTGFHPELTGRENVFLNGAILGMRRREITQKFDDIVEFAEISAFLDTPVKRYSSGMYMRLAFSVAAHLEPDILIVDEVLAVGDAAFQQKSLSKMNSIAGDGRTVLFVSHNMLAIQDLCHRVVWMHDGQVHAEGLPEDVVGTYLRTSFSLLTEQEWPDTESAPGNNDIRLRLARVRPVNGSPNDRITIRTSFLIEFEYYLTFSEGFVQSTVNLHNEYGVLVFSAGDDHVRDPRGRPSLQGVIHESCLVPGDLLNDGMYRISVEIRTNGTTMHRQDDLLIFDVEDTLDRRVGWYGEWGGTVRPMLEWETTVMRNDH